MAMLGDVHHHSLLPAEEEVAGPRPGGHRDAEVSIVGHEDEHQEVADHDLDDVQDGLEEVRDAQHLLASRTEKQNGGQALFIYFPSLLCVFFYK